MSDSACSLNVNIYTYSPLQYCDNTIQKRCACLASTKKLRVVSFGNLLASNRCNLLLTPSSASAHIHSTSCSDLCFNSLRLSYRSFQCGQKGALAPHGILPIITQTRTARLSVMSFAVYFWKTYIPNKFISRTATASDFNMSACTSNFHWGIISLFCFPWPNVNVTQVSIVLHHCLSLPSFLKCSMLFMCCPPVILGTLLAAQLF